MADVLKAASIPPLLLLLGFIVVVALIDLLITGAIAKWALFAPIFVPLLMKLGVDPEAVLAAYRVADSPMNVDHAAERLLRAGRRLRSEVRQERGRGDDRGADASVRPRRSLPSGRCSSLRGSCWDCRGDCNRREPRGWDSDGKPWRNGTEVYGDRHALRAGFTIEEILKLTKIDRWFLVQFKEIVDFEEELGHGQELGTSCQRFGIG